MKKFITRIGVFALLLVMTLTLVSCSTYKSILSEFEDEGYVEITDDDNETLKSITAELKEGNITCTFHVLQPEIKDDDGALAKLEKQAKTILIIEFESDEELAKAFEENGSETLKGIIKDAQNSDYVNGNCVLVSILNTEAKDIFKRA